MNRIYGVDICNTIADVNAEVERILGRKIISYPDPDINESFFREHPECLSNAKPFAGAAEILNQIVDSYSLVYVTARPEWTNSLTKEWLKLHGFPLAPIVHTNNKLLVIRQLGITHMLEDSPFEIESMLHDMNVTLYKKEHPYNKQFVIPTVQW